MYQPKENKYKFKSGRAGEMESWNLTDYSIIVLFLIYQLDIKN